MACVQFTNWAWTELADAINASQTQIVVVSTDMFIFEGAQLQPGDWFYLTLQDANSFNQGLQPPSTKEIIKVTTVDYTTNTLTVVRGLDGTTATAFSRCDIAAHQINAASQYDNRLCGGGGSGTTGATGA